MNPVQRILRIASYELGVIALLASVIACSSAPALAECLRLSTSRYALSLEGSTASDLKLIDVKSQIPLVVSGDVLWELRSSKGPHLQASAVPIKSAKTTGRGAIRIGWEHRDADVAVDLSLDDAAGLGMTISVTNHRVEPITEIEFPRGLAIDLDDYDEMIIPDRIGEALSMADWFGKGGTLGAGVRYPCAYADLLVAKGRAGKPSLAMACTHTEKLLIPSRMFFGNVLEYPHAYSHLFYTWIAPGSTWQSPPVRIFAAESVFGAFAEYRRLVGLGNARTLRQKLADKFETAKKAVVLKYECGNYYLDPLRKFEELVKGLPKPLIIEAVTFQPTGHDASYPDYFPVSPNLGKDEDFRKMVSDAHQMGHLVMPFFDPALWTIDSPSAVKAGPQIAVVGQDGKPVTYDARKGNGGLNYFVTAWHPLIIPKAIENLEQFKAFGCDAAFSDIVGAVYQEWDFNPSSPTPRSYFAGMIELGRRMSQVMPVATEGGDDLHSASFWAMFSFYLSHKYTDEDNAGQPWVEKMGYKPDWSGRASAKLVRLYPMTYDLASGLTMIYPHNLAPPIMDMQMLADSLSMGMGLYMRYVETRGGRTADFAGLPWLRYLSYLQDRVVQHYFGQEMIGFDYIVGFDQVSVTRWENFDLYVNHTPNQVTLEVGGQRQTLQGYEMLAVSPGRSDVIPSFDRWRASHSTRSGDQ